MSEGRKRNSAFANLCTASPFPDIVGGGEGAEVFNFYEVQFILICNCYYYVCPKKYLLSSISQRFPPLFSSRVLALTFKSMIHLKLIFIWYELVVEVHFSPYKYSFISEPFVKKTFFSTLNYLGTPVEHQLNTYEWCICGVSLLFH